MLPQLNLQRRLIVAFLAMGLIVLTVAFVGYSATSALSNYITILTQNSLPSVAGLWKINEGQTQIESGERLLLLPELLPPQRQAAIARIEQAWSQINLGFKLVKATPLNNQVQKSLYKKFMHDWNTWQQVHHEFMELEQLYNSLGIRNPDKLRAELIEQGKRNSHEIEKVKTALVVRSQLYQIKLKEEPTFQAATNSLLKLLDNNQQFNQQIQQAANLKASQTQLSVTVGMIVGPSLALVWGIFLSIKVARPVDNTIEAMIQELELSHANLAQQMELKTQELTAALQNFKSAQSHLIKSEKMSSLGQMVAGIAQEINNPVNFIHGNLNRVSDRLADLLNLLQLYQRQYPHPADQIQTVAAELNIEFMVEDLPRMLSSMKLRAERIHQIVLSLQNFSPLDEAEMKVVDIHEGLNSTLLILNHRLKQGIEIKKSYGILPLIECYPAELYQVFMNLIVNAIDAVEARRDKLKQITLVTKVLNDEYIQVKIRDNGVGIAPNLREKIFEPFFTTKSARKQKGLGLAISYQIIQKHGGQIDVVSEPGKGTEFTIILPTRNP
jgi:signal transduction histidine kinase